MDEADDKSFETKILLLKSCFYNDPCRFLNNKIAPPSDVLMSSLRKSKIDSLLYLHTNQESFIQDLYDNVLRIQHSYLQNLLVACELKGVHAIVFKGAELAKRYYRGRAISLSNDIDLLFNYSDLTEVKHILCNMGFRQGKIDEIHGGLINGTIDEIAQIEQNHYELVPFRRFVEIEITEEQQEFARSLERHPIWIFENKVFVAVEFDIHHRVAIDIESKGIIDRAVKSSFDNSYTLCPTDHVWLLTSRLYNEVARKNKRSLRDFAYLAHIISRESIDWQLMIKIATQFNIKSTLYYYFKFLCMLEEEAVPLQVLCELKPNQHHRSRDYGWQLLGFFDMTDISPIEQHIYQLQKRLELKG